MHMSHTLTLAIGIAALEMTPGCGGGDKTSDSSSGTATGTGGSTGSTGATTTGATGTGTGTGGPTTGTSNSGTTGTSEPGTTTAGTTTAGTTTAGTTTAGTTTAGTTTGETTTGDSSGGSSSSASSSGGQTCGGQGDSCAGIGALCCMSLDCCAGVPVPEGKEFCSADCPKSDRRLKADFAELDAAEVLRKLVALPITSWRYRKDGPEVRHIGPMAQDFHAAFGLWDSDTMIFPLDASGVSMAAIQAMHARLLTAEAENEDLRARLDRIESRIESPIESPIESRIERRINAR